VSILVEWIFKTQPSNLKLKKLPHIIVFYSMCPGKFSNKIHIISFLVFKFLSWIQVLQIFWLVVVEKRRVIFFWRLFDFRDLKSCGRGLKNDVKKIPIIITATKKLKENNSSKKTVKISVKTHYVENRPYRLFRGRLVDFFALKIFPDSFELKSRQSIALNNRDKCFDTQEKSVPHNKVKKTHNKVLKHINRKHYQN